MSPSLATWCSGIGAPECAMLGAGWRHHSVAEIEPFPCAVLGARLGAGPPEALPDPDEADLADEERSARRGAIRAIRAHPWPADPAVPNLGDLTAPDFLPRFLVRGIPDVIVAGTPCQAFSVAGRRAGLNDARGNLTLVALDLLEGICDAARSAGRPSPTFLWENVPGVLSDRTNAFGCLLAGLVGHDSPLEASGGGGWADAGMVAGPARRAAWRVLDAQYFGLAQRRARVFLVASPPDGPDPARVLFERAGVQRHPPARREAGEGLARGPGGGAAERSHWDGDFPHPTLNQSAKGSGGVGASNQEIFSQRGAYLAPAQAFGGNNTSGPINVAPALLAQPGSGWKGDFDSETFVVEPPHAFDARQSDVVQYGAISGPLDTHGNSVGVLQKARPLAVSAKDHDADAVFAVALRGREGGGAAEMGDDRSNALRASQGGSDKPYVLAPHTGEHDAGSPEAHASAVLRALRDTVGEEAFAEWRSGVLDSLQSPEVLRAWLHGACLRRPPGEAGPELGDSTLARQESVPAGALRVLWVSGPDGRSPQGRRLAEQLARESGKTLPKLPHQAAQASAVRRLLPVETERLQGFPDGWTDVPFRRKRAADGPRYKAIGNSMAVPVLRWLLARLGALMERRP